MDSSIRNFNVIYIVQFFNNNIKHVHNKEKTLYSNHIKAIKRFEV